MKVLSIASIFALFTAVALALPGYDDDYYGRGRGGSYHGSSAASAGGNNNEGRVNGALNNVLKHGILADNEKVADTTIAQGGY